jgi:hypothetical protein
MTDSTLTLLVRDRWGREERRRFDQDGVETIRRTDSLRHGDPAV